MKTRTINERRAGRRRLYVKVAAALFEHYDQIRESDVDTGIAGSEGEELLKAWINKWLPKRLSTKSGAVISQSDGPTDQMDCLLFDQHECPVFHTTIKTELLPIEGVLGCIEMNYGESTAYTKILTDCEKLSRLADLALPDKQLPRMGIPTFITSINQPEVHSLDRRTKMANLYRTTLGNTRPLLFIYAEDINGNLEEAGRRIMQYNKSVGVYHSIDGLFVLKQGVVLHRDDQGWHTQRIPGDKMSVLRINNGEVLMRLQNQILHHLWITGKTNPQGFEAYINDDGKLQETMDAAVDISDADYRAQMDELAIRIG